MALSLRGVKTCLCLTALTFSAVGPVAALQVDKPTPTTQDVNEALAPVLETLRKLDSKAFATLSKALSGPTAKSNDKPFQSFLQFFRGTPSDDETTERKLEALQPVLEKLKKLDPKSFGLLSNTLALGGNGGQKSLLQVEIEGEPANDQKVEALQPVLKKLKGLDPKIFGVLSNLLKQSGTMQGTSFLQMMNGDQPDSAKKLEALQPVLQKLRNLDPKTFGMLSKLLTQKDQASFLQRDTSKPNLEALEPVMSKLKGLDPKTFGLLKGLLAQAATKEGAAFLEIASGSAPSQEERLQALQPVLQKLQKLDSKTFGMLSRMLTQAQTTQ